MKLQVLGTGCERCETLYRNTVEAAERVRADKAEICVEKVADPEVFLRLKVYMTPALVIDDEVVSKGKPLTSDQIEAEIRKRVPGGHT